MLQRSYIINQILALPDNGTAAAKEKKTRKLPLHSLLGNDEMNNDKKNAETNTLASTQTLMLTVQKFPHGFSQS
jgi:hypothetical protein